MPIIFYIRIQIIDEIRNLNNAVLFFSFAYNPSKGNSVLNVSQLFICIIIIFISPGCHDLYEYEVNGNKNNNCLNNRHCFL